MGGISRRLGFGIAQHIQDSIVGVATSAGWQMPLVGWSTNSRTGFYGHVASAQRLQVNDLKIIGLLHETADFSSSEGWRTRDCSGLWIPIGLDHPHRQSFFDPRTSTDGRTLMASVYPRGRNNHVVAQTVLINILSKHWKGIPSKEKSITTIDGEKFITLKGTRSLMSDVLSVTRYDGGGQFYNTVTNSFNFGLLTNIEVIAAALNEYGKDSHYFSESGHHERYRATYTGRSKNSWTHLIEALLPERYGLEIDELLATAQRTYAFDTYDGIPLAEVGRSFDTNVRVMAQKIADLVGLARAPHVIEALVWILNRG